MQYSCIKFLSIWRNTNFETKSAQIHMTNKNFGKINTKIVIKGYSNISLHQILVNLETFRFWDQVSPKKYE